MHQSKNASSAFKYTSMFSLLLFKLNNIVLQYRIYDTKFSYKSVTNKFNCSCVHIIFNEQFHNSIVCIDVKIFMPCLLKQIRC